MKYQGSCHCGSIKFVAEGELSEVLSCNCSICQKKGSLLWFLPSKQVKISLEPLKIWRITLLTNM